jgi:polyisoprenoid-binding protein YceI
MKRRVLLFAFSLVCLISAPAAPITLHVDNTHSSIQFSVPFMAISEVTGRVERFCGHIVLNETNPVASRMELFIDASSINTGLKIRDRDLVEKYLETKKYPIIYFKSKSIRPTKQKLFDVTGNLLLHGVSKEIHITLTLIGDVINGDNARELGFKLQPVKINRTDYGIMEGAMGSGSVGDTVTTSAIIRVRDVTPYRGDLDKRFPEKTETVTIPFNGSFRGKSGALITLVNDDGNYFLAFSDDEWSWFAEAKVVGPNLFKLLSFGQLVELKTGTITVTRLGEQAEVFAVEEKK